MDLEIPVIDETEDPQWSQDFNDNFEVIKNHTHANGDGVNITTAALTIDDDLPINGHNVIGTRTVRFSNLGADPVAGTDVVNLYAKNGDVYWNNASGAHVRITNGLGLNISVGTANVFATVSVNSNQTILSTDTYDYLQVDSTSTAISIFLPAANTVTAGRFYYIKDYNGSAATHNISIIPNGANVIDGQNTTLVLQDNHSAILLVSDGGSSWDVFTSIPGGLTPIIRGALGLGLTAPLVSIAATTSLSEQAPTIVLTSTSTDIRLTAAGNILINKVPTFITPLTSVGRIQPLTILAGGNSGVDTVPADWFYYANSFNNWAAINKTSGSRCYIPLIDTPDLSTITSLVITSSGAIGAGAGFSVLPTGSGRAGYTFVVADGYGATAASTSVFDDSVNIAAFQSAHKVTLDLTGVSSIYRTIDKSANSVDPTLPYQLYLQVTAPSNNYVANSFGIIRVQAFFTVSKLTPG